MAKYMFCFSRRLNSLLCNLIAPSRPRQIHECRPLARLFEEAEAAALLAGKDPSQKTDRHVQVVFYPSAYPGRVHRKHCPLSDPKRRTGGATDIDIQAPFTSFEPICYFGGVESRPPQRRLAIEASSDTRAIEISLCTCKPPSETFL
jgi:hypothetical protein